MNTIKGILSGNLVVPVVTLERTEDIVPICEALLEGGITVIEVTLRTQTAMAAIGEAAKRFPNLAVGAGTLVKPEQVLQVIDLGAQFGVSPGSPPALLEAVEAACFPFLPGGATVSEFMCLDERGFNILKFFPAEPSGGVSFLKSVSTPLSKTEFCPTGGINEQNVADYLALHNVIAVGGSWFVNPERIRRRAWNEITSDASVLSAKFGKGDLE